MAKNVKKGGAKKKANAYKKAPPIPVGEVLVDNMGQKWILGDSIGAGGFGAIYSARKYDGEAESHASYPYVVKIEPIDNGPLFVETNFYRNINYYKEDIDDFKASRNLPHLGMPTCLASGEHVFNYKWKLQFLVLERYGTDIHKLFEKAGRFPAATVFQIGLQVLDVLEYIHEHNYIHADIKGANIMVGLRPGTEHLVYLLDFGLAWRVKDRNYEPNPKNRHEGTLDYTSRDRHRGAQTMRGDLEILGYNMLQWLTGSLPWETFTDPDQVQRVKEQFMNSLEDIKLKYTSVPDELIKFFGHIDCLDMGDIPDHTWCQQLFESYLSSVGKTRTSQLEFPSPATEARSEVTNLNVLPKDLLTNLGNDSEQTCFKESNDSEELAVTQKGQKKCKKRDVNRKNKETDNKRRVNKKDNKVVKKRGVRHKDKEDAVNKIYYESYDDGQGIKETRPQRVRKKPDRFDPTVYTSLKQDKKKPLIYNEAWKYTEDTDSDTEKIENTPYINPDNEIPLRSPEIKQVKDNNGTSTSEITKSYEQHKAEDHTKKYDDVYLDVQEIDPGNASNSVNDSLNQYINRLSKMHNFKSKKKRKEESTTLTVSGNKSEESIDKNDFNAKVIETENSSNKMPSKNMTDKFFDYLSSNLSSNDDLRDLTKVLFTSSSKTDKDILRRVAKGKVVDKINAKETQVHELSSISDDEVLTKKTKPIVNARKRQSVSDIKISQEVFHGDDKSCRIEEMTSEVYPSPDFIEDSFNEQQVNQVGIEEQKNKDNDSAAKQHKGTDNKNEQYHDDDYAQRAKKKKIRQALDDDYTPRAKKKKKINRQLLDDDDDYTPTTKKKKKIERQSLDDDDDYTPKDKKKKKIERQSLDGDDDYTLKAKKKKKIDWIDDDNCTQNAEKKGTKNDDILDSDDDDDNVLSIAMIKKKIKLQALDEDASIDKKLKQNDSVEQKDETDRTMMAS